MISREVWAQFAKDIPLPDDEQVVRYRTRKQQGVGRVFYCFLAEDEVAIQIEDGPVLFPAFGDTWESTNA